MACFLNLSDPGNPFRLDNGDNSVVLLITDPLTADNYPTWTRAMRCALRAKNKVGFVMGDIPRPSDPDDPLLEAWEHCNDMVASWLQNSISASIKSSVVFVDDARDIWIDLQDRFSHQNGPRIFRLKHNLANLLQEHDSVSAYYGTLKTLWDELSIYDLIPVCNCGTMSTLLDRYQRDCVFQFLMGLNDIYSNVRDQIILLDPIPPVTRVFSLIQQQERQHQLTHHAPSPDSMALAIKIPFSPQNFSPQTRPHQKRDRPFCTHCKITGHTFDTCFKAGNVESPLCTHCHLSGHVVDKCYKLHSYPPGHIFFNKASNPTVLATQSSISYPSQLEETSDDKVGLTKAQFQQLMALLQLRELSIAAQHFANQIQSKLSSPHSNLVGISLSLSTHTHHALQSNTFPWIIDTGATDHMVCYPSLFTSTTSFISHTVKLPNGTEVPVSHIGIVQLTASICLTDVLCVPSFTFNLFSAKKLATSLTCYLIFFSDLCFI
ncbi:uncharacterized protein LOC118349715 [Juglans regia]|uniref:Uncharacterized protein LOC118349715 n=1 Tax=Juglans regia TaxID=51240 RepID=A0A6P9EQT0_JUGRE|nr:uncharacterized protein LOC118349715 [Juglans regia]